MRYDFEIRALLKTLTLKEEQLATNPSNNGLQNDVAALNKALAIYEKHGLMPSTNKNRFFTLLHRACDPATLSRRKNVLKVNKA